MVTVKGAKGKREIQNKYILNSQNEKYLKNQNEKRFAKCFALQTIFNKHQYE